VLLQRPLVMAASCTGAVILAKTFSSLILTINLGPWFHKHNACLSCARDADRHCDVGVLMLHYQVASDSPGGATSNSKMSELGYHKHVYCILALKFAKNRIIIFCSLLDIRENVLLDSLFGKMNSGLVFWPTLYSNCKMPKYNKMF